MSDPEEHNDATGRGGGLPMVQPPDPEALAEERKWLAEMDAAPPMRRTLAFLKRGGPGYLQSAMTLGGGTAASSLFAGAAFGYDLLWVAPFSMLLGVIMLSAVAHQTLSTGMRPFEAMRVHAGPVFAWGWAIGALLSSFIWHFAQYSLAGAVIEDMGDQAGIPISRWIAGLLVLAWAIGGVLLYGSSPRWMKVFERTLRGMVYMIILCFGFVVVKTGIAEPGKLLAGFFAFKIPDSINGIDPSWVVVSGLAAAVGVNMLFLYPYTLLARGWGKEHRRIARFDLFAGMFLPYLFAASLMVIATANVLHYGAEVPFADKSLSPVTAAGALAPAVGGTFGRMIFDFGILGMAASSIALHMLCCGFACSEMFGWKVGSLKYKLACLIPIPGVLGAGLWGDMKLWIAVPTTILTGFLLPLAYLGFIKLQRSRAYLGDDLPRGPRATAWLGGMVFATLVLVVFLAWFSVTKGPAFFADIF